jgi:hypothetical protein
MNVLLAVMAFLATLTQMMLEMSELGRASAIGWMRAHDDRREIEEKGLKGRAARRVLAHGRSVRGESVKAGPLGTWLSLVSWTLLTFVAGAVLLQQL